MKILIETFLCYPTVFVFIFLFDDTRSVESLISAKCQKLDFPVLRKQLCQTRFASGFQCMTSMTVKNKRHFNPSCSRLAIK